MTKLNWNEAGNRFFEAGVDRGVLYPMTGDGVAWNGLIAVDENPSGGEATPYYIDGVKYLNVASMEEFGGTIEAYTYPDEFAACDGTASFGGLEVHQQERSEFNFSYRTLIGNDIDGATHGYKIHLVYNALATPTQNTYGSLTDDPEALTFAWEFTTRADTGIPMESLAPLSTTFAAPTVSKSSLIPFSHVTIDSTKTSPDLMLRIENHLYGTKSTPPKLLSLSELFKLYENPLASLLIEEKPTTGLSPLVDTYTNDGDLKGNALEGLYNTISKSRLTETSVPGLYTLE